MAPRYVCFECGTPLDATQPGTWLELSGGLIQLRAGGGAHSVRNARFTGRRWCHVCMDLKQQYGTQLPLFC